MTYDIACVGHNTVDKYMNKGMMYPGGNEVNVAALTSRFGLSSSYIGWVGNDVYGNLIIDALKSEGVNISHCHIKEGVNTFTEIYHEEGERHFGEIRRGVGTETDITSDVDFILKHSLLHTGFYSKMENFLKQYHDQILISFDFTEYAKDKYIKKHIKYVDIAFISSNENGDLEKLMGKYFELGPEIVVMTRGKEGSYLYDGEIKFQPSLEVKPVIDTLGAGDSFISRFLVEYRNGTENEKSLLEATRSAAHTCTYFGAFGHGKKIPNQ